MDFVIYGLDGKGRRKQLAHTPSARAAKLYQDSRSTQTLKVVVRQGDVELSGDELDQLAIRDNRLSKRY